VTLFSFDVCRSVYTMDTSQIGSLLDGLPMAVVLALSRQYLSMPPSESLVKILIFNLKLCCNHMLLLLLFCSCGCHLLCNIHNWTFCVELFFESLRITDCIATFKCHLEVHI